MDRDPCVEKANRQTPGAQSVLAVSSRHRALDRLRATILAGATSPVLLTGESGSGKTWLAHQISCTLPTSWLTARIDMTRATGALDFLHLLAHALGAPAAAGTLGAARAGLHAFLHDETYDGRRWLLVIDEAHRAAPAVWDEIKAVVNHSGRPDGFAGIVVLADTELVRALGFRDFRGAVPSFDSHLHLLPLDLDEAAELLGFIGHDFHPADRRLEEWHRDACGNPRALIRLAGSWPTPTVEPDRALRTADRSSAQRLSAKLDWKTREASDVSDDGTEPRSMPRATTTQGAMSRNEPTMLIPSRPPLRVEEGLVEVGWDGDLASEPGETDGDAIEDRSEAADGSSFNEELIEDRYAALQAWTEWTKSQEQETSRRVATEATGPRGGAEATLMAVETPATDEDEHPHALEPVPVNATSGVRAEPQHEFAPYSQLFTRLRQSKQP